MDRLDHSSVRDATQGSLIRSLEARLAYIDGEEARLTQEIQTPKTPMEIWTYAVVRRNDISLERAHILRRLLELGQPAWCAHARPRPAGDAI